MYQSWYNIHMMLILGTTWIYIHYVIETDHATNVIMERSPIWCPWNLIHSESSTHKCRHTGQCSICMLNQQSW